MSSAADVQDGNGLQSVKHLCYTFQVVSVRLQKSQLVVCLLTLRLEVMSAIVSNSFRCRKLRFHQ